MTTFSLPDSNFAIVLERVGAVEIRPPYHPTQLVQQPTRYGRGWSVIVTFTDADEFVVQRWPERVTRAFSDHIDADAEARDHHEAEDLYWTILRSLDALREVR